MDRDIRTNQQPMQSVQSDQPMQQVPPVQQVPPIQLNQSMPPVQPMPQIQSVPPVRSVPPMQTYPQMAPIPPVAPPKIVPVGKGMRIVSILSPALLIFGFLYFLGGLHPDEWDQNTLLRLFPSAAAWLIIPFRLFWILILPTLTATGKFGVELITLAYTGRSLYKAKQGIGIKGAFSAVSRVIAAVMIVWHLLLVVLEGQSLQEGIIYFILAIVVCRLVGLAAGRIINAVSKLDSVVKKAVWTMVIIILLAAVNVLSALIL